MKDKIAGKLLEANLVSQDQLHKALDLQNKDGGSVGQNLVRTGALSEMAYTEFLGKMYSLPTVALAETEITTLQVAFERGGIVRARPTRQHRVDRGTGQRRVGFGQSAPTACRLEPDIE